MKIFMKRLITLTLVVALAFSLPIGFKKSVSADESTVNANVYFVSAATGKLITLDGVTDNHINCNTDYSGESSVPSNGKFKIYYGKQSTGIFQGKTVVNFTCEGTNTSWKADHNVAYQIAKRTNPDGWESVYMEPQGNGTVGFRSCASGKYFTVNNYNKDELGLVEVKEGEETSNNERFIPYTSTQPKTITNSHIDSVSGSSFVISWTGVDECIYSGYEVLYSTSKNGEYKSAGSTGETSFEVEGLSLNTTYFVKVRTTTWADGGPFSDSETIEVKTKENFKPAKVENLSVEKTDKGMELSWDASSASTSYEVYRGESRFDNYELISTVNTTKFVDTNPNKSKYKNYYKVRGINSSETGSWSEPASLELNMFGEDMYVFAETDNRDDINKVTTDIYSKQHTNQFGIERYTFAYKPGNYVNTDTVNIGYYTQILGLGKVPSDVKLRNVKMPAALSDNNATCNFWVGLENATIVDTDYSDSNYNSFQWAASQAAPARRLDVERKGVFDWYYGWASGGFIADSRFRRAAGSLSQQQYYYRNCFMEEEVYGVNWNQVIQGCSGTPIDKREMRRLINGNGVSNWYQRSKDTVIDKTPVVREKPFLYFDEETDNYRVFIPALRKDSSGISWKDDDMGQGTSISVEDCFYIANPEKDTGATLNAQLKKGKNIILRPGVYHVEEPLKVTRSNTVLLGLGLATLVPDNSDTAIKVSDVGGVSIAGLIIDAGNHSESMVQVGDEGCNKDHSENPIVLHDIFFRVGGAKHLGRCDACLVVNSNNTIIDHTWIWRADHGDNSGWTVNTAKNGMVVNGDDVTTYGLFCEHFQEYDIIWRGERGSTYFLQNEKCYDPQNQDDWMSHDGTKKGFAAYKVTNNVKEHYAVGLGVYDVFINTNGASIFLDNAFEVPDTPNVILENATIVEIANEHGPKVGINHIVNDTVAGIRTGEDFPDGTKGYALQRLLRYRNGESISLEDYYVNKTSTTVVEEEGVTPTLDSYAEKDIKKEPSSKDNEKPIWEMTDKDYIDRMDKSDDKKKDDSKKAENINGKTIVSGKYIYKVKSASKNTGKASLVGVVKKYQKKLKKVNVNATIKYKTYTLKITDVGKKAFKKCKKIKTLTIGKYVETIQSKAFADSKKLKKINIKGKALKKVSKNAFNKKVRKKVKIKGKKKPKKVILKALKRKK